MALDAKGNILMSPEITTPEGHMANPGRADLADIVQGRDSSVEDVVDAISRVTREMHPHRSPAFEKLVIDALRNQSSN